jgi:hypothetical protein
MDAKWWQKLTLPLARWAKKYLTKLYNIELWIIQKVVIVLKGKWNSDFSPHNNLQFFVFGLLHEDMP